MNENKNIFIEDELINSYLSYAMSVIIGRALPDVRDGLKPVHRRTLFVMSELNNRFNKTYKKSARIVGDVIGKYHPHGELAVYNSIVRLVQLFTQRYPLIDGQGNFGSIDGDPAAAMRYTEIRMSEIAEYLLSDLNFSTVNYIPNYDNTETYPSILPAMVPNLLINGSCGIAVGMATNIPPHNLTEVINACLGLISKPEINIDELMAYIKGPDFPTSGSICGVNGIINAYKTGRGKIVIKSKVKIKTYDDDISSITITELPYQVNKARLLEKILILLKEKKIDGIKTIRDESDKDGLRIFIEVFRGRNPNIILNKLYSLTKLQSTFNVNMVALVDNIPRLLNLKEIIKYFIDHRKEVIYRRIQYKLLHLEDKLHILEGLLIALLNMTFIIDLISLSKNYIDLKYTLSSIVWNNELLIKIDNNKFINSWCHKLYKYKFSMLQVQAVLNMKLSNLMKLEKYSVINDYNSIVNSIISYNHTLKDNISLNSIIKEELLFLKNKFGDNRRTNIIPVVKKLTHGDFIDRKEVVVTLSNDGYIKSQPVKTYNVQHRGGKGKLSMFIKSGDFVQNLLVCDSHSILLCFSTFGKVYWIDLCIMPLSSRTSKGLPIVNEFNLEKNEKINVILSTKNYDKNTYILIVTFNGLIKKILLNEFKNKRSNGIIAINLLNDDHLVDVKLVKQNDEIMLFSNTGKALRFSVEDIRSTGRMSRGVIGMRLGKDECIVSLIILDKKSYIVTATEYGYGKKTKADKFPCTRRGGKGVLSIRFDKKKGNVVKVEKVFDKDNLLLLTSNGIMSRINVEEISSVGRNSKGIFLINLSKNETLVCMKKI